MVALRAMMRSDTVDFSVNPWHDVHRITFRHGVDRVVVVTQPRRAYLRRDAKLLQHERNRPMAGRLVARIFTNTSSIRTLSICDAIACEL